MFDITTKPTFAFLTMQFSQPLPPLTNFMKYYLVNYIMLDKKTVTVTENENIGIPLHTFANIDDFKKSIASLKNDRAQPEDIIIKSYKQISQEAFQSLNASFYS